MIRSLPRFAFLVFLVLAGSAHAAGLVEVIEPWARATVPGQSVGGVYMDLVASQNLRLVGVKTPAAELGEVHQMKMEKGMMRMRALPFLSLPAGKKVKLKPGGYHIMLTDLKNSLVEGQKLKLELVVEDNMKHRHTIPVEALIRDREARTTSGHDMR